MTRTFWAQWESDTFDSPLGEGLSLRLMYSIGEFSRVTQLTIKALRFYHEKGILVPSHIDEQTGYRSYSTSDVGRARTITLLKGMMFSLAEIREMLSDYEDESELLDLLRTKQHALEVRTNALKEASKGIENLIKQQTEGVKLMTMEQFEVEEKEIGEILVASLRWKGRYQDTGSAFSRIYKQAGRHSHSKALNLYYDSEYKESDADIESCVPIRREISLTEGTVKTLSGGRFATLIHKGPYEQISRTYEKLFAHLKQKKHSIQVPTREVYIKGPGMILKGNPKNYLTEIQIKIG